MNKIKLRNDVIIYYYVVRFFNEFYSTITDFFVFNTAQLITDNEVRDKR